MLKKKNIVSLFSGAGGLDYAFHKIGAFETRVYVESEPLFAETLRVNQGRGLLSQGSVIEGSVAELLPKNILSELLASDQAPWILIGGPPCESFSAMGKHGGLRDTRGPLIFDMVRWANLLDVKVFVLENVPNLLKIDKGEVFERLLSMCSELGYQVRYEVLCAADYGAPTVRKRVILVGTRGLEPFSFPVASHRKQCTEDLFDKRPKWVTSREALAGLPKPSLTRPGNPQGHVLIKHTPVVQERFSKLEPGAVDKIRKRNRLDPDAPSPGLYAGNLEGVRSHIHPLEPRELTNREAARIQGFPDEYLFNGNRVAVGKQIANAVPIELGAAIANAICRQYLGEGKGNAL